MESIILTPQECSATYQGGMLTIDASGHEDGVSDVRIVSLTMDPMQPPQFQVEGEQSAAIGYFPYEVEASFPMDQDPHEIAIVSPSGTKIVSVRSLTAH